MNFLIITYIVLPILYIGYAAYLLKRRKQLLREQREG